MLNKKEVIVYSIVVLLIIVLTHILPKTIILLATPAVMPPEFYNETIDVQISVFVKDEKVVIRACSCDEYDGPSITAANLNLTASNGTKIYQDVSMTNIGYCTPCTYTERVYWEKNYTLSNDPDGNWWANVTVYDSYGDTGSNGNNFSVQIPPKFSGNQTNTTLAGQPCNFTLDWTDNSGLSGYIFSTNNSGTWKNASFVEFSGKTNTSWNVTTLHSTVGTIVQWCYYANDTSNNWNGSSCDNPFELITTSEIPPTIPIGGIIIMWLDKTMGEEIHRTENWVSNIVDRVDNFLTYVYNIIKGFVVMLFG